MVRDGVCYQVMPEVSCALVDRYHFILDMV